MPFIEDNQPTKPITLAEQKAERKGKILRMTRSLCQRDDKQGTSKKRTPLREKSAAVDLLLSLNYKRVYADHGICMGKYTWRDQIKEKDASVVKDDGQRARSVTATCQKSSKVPKPSLPFNLDAFTLPPRIPAGTQAILPSENFRLPAGIVSMMYGGAEYHLVCARNGLSNKVDRANLDRKRAGKKETKLYRPGSSVPKRQWWETLDSKGLIVFTPKSSPLKEVMDHEDAHTTDVCQTPITTLAAKSQQTLALNVQAFDILFETWWSIQLVAAEKLVRLQMRTTKHHQQDSPPHSPTKAGSGQVKSVSHFEQKLLSEKDPERGRQQKRQKHGGSGRLKIKTKSSYWEEDSMRCVRREISP